MLLIRTLLKWAKYYNNISHFFSSNLQRDYKVCGAKMIDSICTAVLDALRFSLFGGQKPTLIDIDVNLKEPNAQSVLSMVYSVY